MHRSPHLPTCKRKKKSSCIPVSCKTTLKAFVKLECCFLNRIKAQIFFLCSQIDIQQPIKAGGHILGKKCLMSEELLVTKRESSAGRLSIVVLARLRTPQLLGLQMVTSLSQDKKATGNCFDLNRTVLYLQCAQTHTQLTISLKACAALKLSKQGGKR